MNLQKSHKKAADALLAAYPASKWGDAAQDAMGRLAEALSYDVARHMAEMFLGRPLPRGVLRWPTCWDGRTLEIAVDDVTAMTMAAAVEEGEAVSMERWGYAGLWTLSDTRKLLMTPRAYILTYRRQ